MGVTELTVKQPELDMNVLLREMIERGASDLHITVGSPPQFRIDGSLIKMDAQSLTEEDTRRLCFSILDEKQIQRFEEKLELDFSFGIPGVSRFRGNIYRQRGAVAGAFRTIPFEVADFVTLGLPPVLNALCEKPRGMILVTGPTGSGKSTTLASMIDKINRERSAHIVTIEDPIEFLHTHKRSLVNQREIGTDTESFREALKHILRQDPDIVLIGEMRDLETIQAALNIAETGHLTLGTLHTNNCVQTINRIIDVFPENQQQQVRTQLSFVLEGVISQQLIPKINGGRVVAVEVMIPTPGIRNLIREGKFHQIYAQMQMGQAQLGMQTMNQDLLRLYLSNQISREDVLNYATDIDEMLKMLETMQH